MAAAIRELRLAVVCYGGVSLAIYMHGQTREMHHLARASALLDADAPEAAVGSERVYCDLLTRLAQQDDEHVRTRVVVDVLAGTSAGGINAIYLAKALAGNLSQDRLRDVWLTRGDISVLLHGPRWVPWQLRMVRSLAELWRRPPLRGDAMSTWLHDALEGMDADGRRPASLDSLMPAGHALRLFVTVTDFHGYPRQVMVADRESGRDGGGRAIYDWRHRHVLEFRRSDGQDQLGRRHNAALALAARITSSFPGAFGPVKLEAFDRHLREHVHGTADVGAPDLEDEQFRHYRLSRVSAREAFFIDGGVLDNHPFGHALSAIREQPADREVDRRLLYLDPDPGLRSRQPSARPEPPPITTALGAIAGIPRKEPILDDLLALIDHNEQVARLRDVIETSWQPVAARVQELLQDPLDDLPAHAGHERIAHWAETVHSAARGDAALAYAAYVRAKLSAAVDGCAKAMCASAAYPDDCSQALFARTALRTWARSRGLFDRGEVTEAQIGFLRSFDIDYGLRRIRFVIDGVNWLYRERKPGGGSPSRQELDAVKRRLYEAVAVLSAVRKATLDGGNVADRVTACFGEEAFWEFSDKAGFHPEEFARRYADDLDDLLAVWRGALDVRLDGVGAALYAEVAELTCNWDRDDRRDLFVRYLGFPLWDALLFPLQSLSALGERDHVEVLRISPLDSQLRPDAGAGKLTGTRLHHFGAFFSRQGREQDYLWGRLDAAEQLLAILLAGRPPDEAAAWRRRTLEAVVDEEAPGLPHAGELVDELRAALRELPEMPIPLG